MALSERIKNAPPPPFFFLNVVQIAGHVLHVVFLSEVDNLAAVFRSVKFHHCPFPVLTLYFH